MSSYNVQAGGTGAASGAAAGAAMGSVVPGIGTAIGAIVGGVAGGSTGFLGGEPEPPKPLGPGKVLTLGLFQIFLQQFEKMVLAPPPANVNTESLDRANRKLHDLESRNA